MFTKIMVHTGPRGLGGVKAMLLGSRTPAVLAHSAITVLVIPHAASTG
ncbi:MAG: hypothetical protein ABWY02_02225 [Telluria sp.]